MWINLLFVPFILSLLWISVPPLSERPCAHDNCWGAASMHPATLGGDMQYMVTSAFFLHSFCGVFFCCFFVLAIVLWYYVGCHHCPAMACFEWPSLLLARLSNSGLIGGFVIFCACATLANMCIAHHCVMEKWHWKPASKQKGRDELWLCVTIQDANGWQAECHHYMCIISP